MLAHLLTRADGTFKLRRSRGDLTSPAHTMFQPPFGGERLSSTPNVWLIYEPRSRCTDEPRGD